LETQVKDRTIALFTTHMAPEGAPPLQEWIQKFKDAAKEANIIGIFDCQGQLNSRLIKFWLQISRKFPARAGQGQPDATRLERTRTFAMEMINKLKQ
jgi:hypothetical protein